MSLQHHAAAAEEGEGAAGWGLWRFGGGGAYKERGWGDRCAPSPFPQGAVTALASWLVTELPPAPGRGSRV